MSRSGLRDQLVRLPEIIRTGSERLAEESRLVLSTPEHLGLQFVVLTGCGDSASAARAAAFAWHAFAGVPAFYVEAMHVARYYGRERLAWRPGGQLLLAVSSSGRVARVIEAAQQLGASRSTLVCAITGDPSGPLAKATGRMLDSSIGERVAGPALCSYVMSVLALLHLAIRGGEVRGRYTMDEANRLRQMLSNMSDAVATTIGAAEHVVRDLAARWDAYERVEMLGSGPSRASAAFGSAKILEAVGLSSMDQDIEEFMHLQYFERRAMDTPTVLISPSDSAAHSRAIEVRRYLEALARPYVIVSDDVSHGRRVLSHPRTTELFAPILHAALLSMLAAELADLRNESPGRGASGQWMDSANGATVTDSAIEIVQGTRS